MPKVVLRYRHIYELNPFKLFKGNDLGTASNHELGRSNVAIQLTEDGSQNEARAEELAIVRHVYRRTRQCRGRPPLR